MTYATDKGLEIGKQYTYKENGEDYIVTFKRDDGSTMPAFNVPAEVDSDGWSYLDLDSISPFTVAETKAASGFAVTVGGGMTIIELGKELTAAQVAAVFAAVGVA